MKKEAIKKVSKPVPEKNGTVTPTTEVSTEAETPLEPVGPNAMQESFKK